MGISAAELDFYKSEGYLVLRGFFSEDELDIWSQRFVDIAEGKAPRLDGMLVMRDVMVAKGKVEAKTPEQATAKIQDFQDDEVFRTYLTHERLLDVVEAFTGPDIKAIHNMFINKPPNVDGRHPLHQDLIYFPFRPADKIVATWTAIDHATRENGCLTVIPRSHNLGLQRHAMPDWENINFGYLGIEDLNNLDDRVHLEMDPGDVVFFHPLIYHGSGSNKTQGYRKSISAHFASAGCEWMKEFGEFENEYSTVVAYNEANQREYPLVRGRAYEGCI